MAQLDSGESADMNHPDAIDEIVVSVARSEAERDACFALRYRVYVEELGCRIAAADHRRKLDYAAEDDTAILFCAHSGGKLIGTVRVHHGAGMGIPRCFHEACDLPRFLANTPLTRMAAIGRLAIDVPYRGGKTVVTLLRDCFRVIIEDHPDTSLVFILALDDRRLIDVSRLLGFRRVDPERLYMMDVGLSVPMFSTIAASPTRASRKF